MPTAPSRRYRQFLGSKPYCRRSCTAWLITNEENMQIRPEQYCKEANGDRSSLCLALLLPVLVLFTGLALDAGLLYVTKAKLSMAVDAACLMGMKSLSLGNSKAATLATYAFNANYGSNPPTPTITFPVDTYGDQQVHISATATVNTAFIRFVPTLATVSISDTATATRGKLAMSIVLDRSGSMSSNGGGTALQSAVPAFVADFSNTNDEVALISFASNATVNFPINYSFITPITNAVKGLSFSGGTFGTGAGTNSASTTTGPPMSMADQQINKVVAQPGQNLTKVLVYFTDGLMNTVQDTFTCHSQQEGDPRAYQLWWVRYWQLGGFLRPFGWNRLGHLQRRISIRLQGRHLHKYERGQCNHILISTIWGTTIIYTGQRHR